MTSHIERDGNGFHGSDRAVIGAVSLTRLFFGEDRGRDVARLLNHLSLSERASTQLALNSARNLQQFLTLLSAREGQIPERKILEDQAQRELLRYSNAEHTITRPYYPDLTGPHIDLQFVGTTLGRMLAGWSSLHPSLSWGFPEISIRRRREGNPNPTLLGLELQPSFDLWLLDRLYPKGRQSEMHLRLGRLAEEIANRDFNDKDRVVNSLRFLGLANEEEFKRITNETLIQEIDAYGGDAGLVHNFLKFAERSDDLREKMKEGSSKRKTGEAYYCHHLASAWFLWTMIKPEIEKGLISINEATELIAAEGIHDLMEDLPYEIQTQIRWDTVPKSGDKRYTLQIYDSDHTIELSRLQFLLLNAVTKRTTQDWVDAIKNIYDPGDPLNQKLTSKLRRYAALLKTADRWVNFFTLVAGCDSYADALRKLEETKRVFSHVLLNANFAGLGAFEIQDRLDNLDESDTFDAFVAGLSILANIEEELLKAKFGIELSGRINEGAQIKLDNPVAKLYDPDWDVHMWRTIQTELAGVQNGNPPTHPEWWKRRFQILAGTRNIPEVTRENCIPVVELRRHIGLDFFANVLPADSKRPIGFPDLIPYIGLARSFTRDYTPARGVLPGNVDGFVVPLDTRQQHNIQIRDRNRAFAYYFGES